MKLFVILLISVFEAFLLLTYFYGTFQAEDDGWNIIGFPVTFYKHTVAKVDLSAGIETNYFSIFYCLIDVVIYVATVAALNIFIKKINEYC